MPSQAEYSADYFTEQHRNWFANPNTRLFARIARSIETRWPAGTADEAATNPLKVLDVGCGPGDFLKYVHERRPSWALVGVDYGLQPAVPGIRFIKGDICELDLNETFDVIVTLATIEHVPNARRMVAKIAELLRPGGLVFAMTVNSSGLLYRSARGLAAVGIRGPFDRLYSAHHVHHFTRPSLRRLFESAGLVTRMQWQHNIPLKAVDFTATSRLQKLLFQMGVAGCFAVGHVICGCYLQTLVCAKP